MQPPTKTNTKLWKCDKCDLLNYPNKGNCIGCFNERTVFSHSWKCSHCNLINNPNDASCIACFNRINKRCIFSFFASDAIYHGDDTYCNINNLLRISPYASPMQFCYVDNNNNNNNDDYDAYDDKTAPIDFNYKNIVQNDKENGIYYIELGAADNNCSQYKLSYFTTSPLKWPNVSYTMLIWVQWNLNCGTLTTFDSAANAPIVAQGKKWNWTKCKIGCASNKDGWAYLNQYQIDENWTFVAIHGGNSSTKFFIGDLNTKPVFKGVIQCDICGLVTNRIGDAFQGPGKVAYIQVYNYQIDKTQIDNLYYKSKYEIALLWNDKELMKIKEIMSKYVIVDGIIDVIVGYCCDYKYGHS